MLFIGALLVVVYFLYKYLTEKGYRWVGIMMICFLIIYLIYSAYAVISTAKKSSQNEFKEVNRRESIKTKYAVVTEKVNLADELKEEYGGNYMVTFSDSVLALLTFGGMYRPFYYTDSTRLKSILKGYTYKQLPNEGYSYEFSREKSNIQVYHWTVKETTAEYHELRGTFVKGFFRDSEIVFKTGLRIGMSKPEFFSIYFNQYESYLDSVKLIAVYENESADDATIYRFKEGKLVEIEFGNVLQPY